MNRRILKLNKQLQRVLMDYFMRKTKTPLPGFISIKEASMATDMKSAKVFLSVMNPVDCSEEVLAALDQERYWIQRTVSRALQIKFCPHLSFFVNHVSYSLNQPVETKPPTMESI